LLSSVVKRKSWGIFDKSGGFKERELLKCLEENCVRIKGHRLFWRSDADPERLKMLQKAASERQQKKIEVNAGQKLDIAV
jgi:hypothetical protein